LLITGCTSTFVSLYRASSVSSVPTNTGIGDANLSNTFNMSMTLDMASSRTFANDTITDRSLRGGAKDPSQAQLAQQENDRLVHKYELEDSVNAIDWSAADAWIFGAVSYNGTFFINFVPSKEKYKILL